MGWFFDVVLLWFELLPHDARYRRVITYAFSVKNWRLLLASPKARPW